MSFTRCMTGEEYNPAIDGGNLFFASGRGGGHPDEGRPHKIAPGRVRSAGNRYRWQSEVAGPWRGGPLAPFPGQGHHIAGRVNDRTN